MLELVELVLLVVELVLLVVELVLLLEWLEDVVVVEPLVLEVLELLDCVLVPELDVSLELVVVAPVVEAPVPPGGGVPPGSHSDESEPPALHASTVATTGTPSTKQAAAILHRSARWRGVRRGARRGGDPLGRADRAARRSTSAVLRPALLPVLRDHESFASR